MSTKYTTEQLQAQCATRAAELGVELVDNRDGFYITAPSGYVFAASGVHHMPVPWGVKEFYKTRGDALRAVLVEMREGVERCEDDERSESCDVCADLRGEKGGIG